MAWLQSKYSFSKVAPVIFGQGMQLIRGWDAAEAAMAKDKKSPKTSLESASEIPSRQIDHLVLAIHGYFSN